MIDAPPPKASPSPASPPAFGDTLGGCIFLACIGGSTLCLAFALALNLVEWAL